MKRMKKLLLFDLDETLIHVKRDGLDGHMSSNSSFVPEVSIPTREPESNLIVDA